MNPIAQRLAIHAAQPGRLRSAMPLEHQGQREHSANCVRIPRPPRRPPKPCRIKLCTCHRYRNCHLATPRIMQSQENHVSGTRGIPRESKPLAVGIKLKKIT